ncbi:hypothetical protein GQ600_25969 [Phytophthora cactorum]|nr:hypothetical protein GQ600_25969 [Phytophthora cactorum]
MDDEDMDVLGKEQREVRRVVHDLLVDEAWCTVMRCRYYLTVKCLDSPSDSAWMMLYRYGSDLNFLIATSLTRPAFHQLLHRIAEFYTILNHNSRGRPAKLHISPVLGLLLSFYVGPMKYSTLFMLFGAPPSTLSRTLRRAEEALSKAMHPR